MLNELRQRTVQFGKRATDLAEALEQQTATFEVVEVISSSLGDVEPVFATILENATRICEANFGKVYLWDGDAFYLAGANNPSAFGNIRTVLLFAEMQVIRFRSLVETKQPFHVSDIMTLPVY